MESDGAHFNRVSRERPALACTRSFSQHRAPRGKEIQGKLTARSVVGIVVVSSDEPAVFAPLASPHSRGARRFERMSAIAGIFNLDGEPVTPGTVERLTGAMQTHGPDGTHHYRAGAVALGHCWARAHPVDNSLMLPAMLCLAAQRAGHRSMLHGASGDVVLTTLPNYVAPLLQAGNVPVTERGWRGCC